MGVFAQQGPKTSLFKENYAHYWIFLLPEITSPVVASLNHPPPGIIFSAQIAYLGVF